MIHTPPARAAALLSLAAAVASGAACRAATGPRSDAAACPQTYEFGNYGCARVVVVVAGPPVALPASYRFVVSATAVGAAAAGGPTASESPAALGTVRLQLTRWFPPAAGGDTISAWVAARVLDDPRPIVAGVPLPTFAADSVLRVLRFAPVGAVPPVDTVRLALRRP